MVAGYLEFRFCTKWSQPSFARCDAAGYVCGYPVKNDQSRSQHIHLGPSVDEYSPGEVRRESNGHPNLALWGWGYPVSVDTPGLCDGGVLLAVPGHSFEVSGA